MPGSTPPPPVGNPRPGLTPSTLYRAPVGQGPSGPGWLAPALGFWSGRVLATTGTAWAGLCLIRHQHQKNRERGAWGVGRLGAPQKTLHAIRRLLRSFVRLVAGRSWQWGAQRHGSSAAANTSTVGAGFYSSGALWVPPTGPQISLKETPSGESLVKLRPGLVGRKGSAEGRARTEGWRSAHAGTSRAMPPLIIFTS